MSSPDPDLTAILYRALRSEYGLSIATSNPELLRQRFYRARGELGDPNLDAIFFAPDPARPDTHLFLMKKRVKIEGEPANAQDD